MQVLFWKQALMETAESPKQASTETEESPHQSKSTSIRKQEYICATCLHCSTRLACPRCGLVDLEPQCNKDEGKAHPWLRIKQLIQSSN